MTGMSVVRDAQAAEGVLVEWSRSSSGGTTSRTPESRDVIDARLRQGQRETIEAVVGCIVDVVSHGVVEGPAGQGDRARLTDAATELTRRGLGEIARPVLDVARNRPADQLPAAMRAMLGTASRIAHPKPTGPVGTPGSRMLNKRR